MRVVVELNLRLRIHRFKQSQIRNIQGVKESQKFQKAKLEFAECQQLFISHFHYIYSYLYHIALTAVS